MARVTEASRAPSAPPRTRRGRVTLRPLPPGGVEAPGIERALHDGIERNHEGELPPFPAGAEVEAIYVGSALVGVLVHRRDIPLPGAVVFDCVAIAPDARGSAYAAHALLAAERRLKSEAKAGFYARVPRTNGRGLYFMLRCGYAPVPPPIEDGTTWFRRNLTLSAAGAGRRARRSSAPGSSGGS